MHGGDVLYRDSCHGHEEHELLWNVLESLVKYAWECMEKMLYNDNVNRSLCCLLAASFWLWDYSIHLAP